MELTLLWAGLAGVGTWLTSIAIVFAFQSWDNWAFERHSRGEAVRFEEYVKQQQQWVVDKFQSLVGRDVLPRRPAPEPGRPVRPQVPVNDELIGRLSIARLQLVTTVREGTGAATLALAPGHIRGTTLPGQNGNVGIAGHRDTFFQSLAGIRLEDIIEFETMDARYVYQVASTKIVKPEDVSVLKAGLYPELTLVTCYPFGFVGSAPDRFIVKARLISQNPVRQAPSLAKLEEPAPNISPTVTPPTVTPPAVAPPSDPPGKVSFQVGKSRSRQLAPGISVGVTDIDVLAGRVDGWLWVMPDRRTVWLRNQKTKEPLTFYQDGEMRELTIARVTRDSASGYLLLHEPSVR
jgi:LPXTG-site transpeptidase (sortase) family protein